METCSFDLSSDAELTSDLFKQNVSVPQIRLVEISRLPFFTSFYDHPFGSQTGGQNLPPPPAGRVRSNTPAGRGLRSNYSSFDAS